MAHRLEPDGKETTTASAVVANSAATAATAVHTTRICIMYVTGGEGQGWEKGGNSGGKKEGDWKTKRAGGVGVSSAPVQYRVL